MEEHELFAAALAIVAPDERSAYVDRACGGDDALAKLAEHDAAAADLIKLRIFAGLSVEQAARALGLSRTMAYRQWTYARAWLRAQMT